MEVVANFEVKSECSVVADDLRLEIKHPQGLYRALIKNIQRNDYSTPFLLALHIYFDSPDLDGAKEIAEERLADCLNMLAFTVGSGFSRHRIRQIVDCTEDTGMRDVRFWGDAIDHDDPQPFLDDHTTKAIERLSEFQIPPAIRRAMRWYRLGVNAAVPSDQFQYFWFALEIIAEFQKGEEKVPSNCPHCASPLFCKSCETHPVHKRYQKQAIQSLLTTVDKDCDDSMFKRLDKMRNGLMHGETMEEIEADQFEGQKHIVDILGSLVWKALIYQFPLDWFDGSISLGVPSKYVHHKLHGVVHIRTIIPKDAEGNLDLSFSGTKMELVSDGPPQSALPSLIVLTDDQYARLAKLSVENGDHQEMCRRIVKRVNGKKEGRVGCLVLATDFTQIKKAVDGGEVGNWQNLFREIIGRERE
ncbi:MAG: hypothetical protein NT159_21355 [Proteobacteria bacterium]|nr:hypothetical protein [Pseudomonadota bacterium]